MQTTATAVLKVLKGNFGANKTFWLERPSAEGTVIFFGGDQIQDPSAPHEIFRLQDPTVQAEITAAKFPNQHIVVVIPSRLEGCFACYDHFLGKCTRSGEPLGYEGSLFKASSQIASLLQAGLPTADLAKLSYYLVGFSKGGVVLNQVLSEAAELWQQQSNVPNSRMPLTSTPSQPIQHAEAQTFLQNIKEVHYLDVGLNCRGAHLTDPQVLHALAGFTKISTPPMAISLHGTARQWEDKRRPFVKQEKDRFQQALQHAGVPVQEHWLFPEQDPSLLMHFQAIEAMKRAG